MLGEMIRLQSESSGKNFIDKEIIAALKCIEFFDSPFSPL